MTRLNSAIINQAFKMMTMLPRIQPKQRTTRTEIRTEIDKIGCFFFAENRFPIHSNRKNEKVKPKNINSVAEIYFH